MLLRDKQPPNLLRVNRNNTVALTYDIENTSTKLILLNFANGDDSRLRSHTGVREAPALQKSERSCHCLTESAPACACHHRDKNLSPFLKRHKSCLDNSHSANNEALPRATKNAKKPAAPDKLPGLCLTDNKGVTRPHKRSHPHSTQQAAYNRDVEILYSMPSLFHPDFTVGQRRVLLSLARIYTNVGSTHRLNNEFINREYTFLKSTSNNRGKGNDKRPKSSKHKMNKVKAGPYRRGSVETAVKSFGDKDGKSPVVNGLEEFDNTDCLSLDKHPEISSPEVDEELSKWIMSLIHDQRDLLKEEYSTCHNSQSNGFSMTDCSGNSGTGIREKVFTDGRHYDHDLTSEMKEEINGGDSKDLEPKDDVLENEKIFEEEYECEVIARTSAEMEVINGQLQEKIIQTSSLKEATNDLSQFQDGSIGDNATVKEPREETLKNVEAIKTNMSENNCIKRVEVDNEIVDVTDLDVGPLGDTKDVKDAVVGNHSGGGTSEDINDNLNLLRYLSDELRQLMVNK